MWLWALIVWHRSEKEDSIVTVQHGEEKCVEDLKNVNDYVGGRSKDEARLYSVVHPVKQNKWTEIHEILFKHKKHTPTPPLPPHENKKTA